MKKELRLRNSIRQKTILRFIAISAGITLMAGIGFFVISNFTSSTESLAKGNFLPEINSSDMPAVSVKKITPEAFSNDFLINLKSKKDQSLGLFLYDIHGKRVAEHITEPHVGNMMINMTPGDELPQGEYTLMIVGEDLKPQTFRLRKI